MRSQTPTQREGPSASARTYDVATIVDFHPEGGRVRMVLVTDVMHDEVWTQRAVMGLESQFERLAQVLEKRGRPA